LSFATYTAGLSGLRVKTSVAWTAVGTSKDAATAASVAISWSFRIKGDPKRIQATQQRVGQAASEAPTS
jgi:hypothetical protein